MLPGGRFGALATTRRPRAPQAYSSLGRVVHHRQNFEARDIQTGQRSRRGLQQRLEHRTATSLLPLKCFKSFMYIGPFICTNKKSSCQGRIGLASAKTDPPSGARRRGLQQLLEHRTATSLLPLKCFKLFMYLGPFTCTNKKSSCQGRIGLASTKTDPPSASKFSSEKFSTKTTFVPFDYIDSGILKTTRETLNGKADRAEGLLRL
jgi:tRNA(Phe) wybutosine-synthesizing methylase Tyw3